MEKIEEKNLNHYELIYIIPASQAVEDLQTIKDEVKNTIKELAGNIIKENAWEKQRLAYPIKKVTQGYYVICEMNLAPAQLIELDKRLKLISGVLRHLVTAKKIKTEADLKREKEIRAKISKVKEEELRRDLEAVEEKKREEKPKIKKQEKISLEDLDKKLDELLDDSIL